MQYLRAVLLIAGIYLVFLGCTYLTMAIGAASFDPRTWDAGTRSTATTVPIVVTVLVLWGFAGSDD